MKWNIKKQGLTWTSFVECFLTIRCDSIFHSGPLSKWTGLFVLFHSSSLDPVVLDLAVPQGNVRQGGAAGEMEGTVTTHGAARDPAVPGQLWLWHQLDGFFRPGLHCFGRGKMWNRADMKVIALCHIKKQTNTFFDHLPIFINWYYREWLDKSLWQLPRLLRITLSMDNYACYIFESIQSNHFIVIMMISFI